MTSKFRPMVAEWLLLNVSKWGPIVIKYPECWIVCSKDRRSYLVAMNDLLLQNSASIAVGYSPSTGYATVSSTIILYITRVMIDEKWFKEWKRCYKFKG